MSDTKTLYAVMVPTSYGHDLQCTLVEDTGEALSSWISSNKHWGRRDLLTELARKHDPAARFPAGYEVIEVERWSDVPEAVLNAYRVHVAEAEKAAGAQSATPPTEPLVSTPEEIEVARRNLVAELKQMLRRKDLDEYPIDAQTAQDLAEVLDALGNKPVLVCANCEASTFACTACGARVED